MSTSRSITPPSLRSTINTNIVRNYSTLLNEKEFPMYSIDGILNCPPAPPPKNQEIRVCYSCKQTYQIVQKIAPLKVCGECNNK